MNYTFKIESEPQFLAAKAYFLTLGYKDDFNEYNYYRLVLNKFLNFLIDNNKRRILGADKNDPIIKSAQKIKFTSIFTLNIERVIKIKLNDTHEAEISNNGIKVGCQTFPLDIIDELVEARKQLN